MEEIIEGETMINVQKYDLSQVLTENCDKDSNSLILAQGSQKVCNRGGGGFQEGGGNEK